MTDGIGLKSCFFTLDVRQWTSAHWSAFSIGAPGSFDLFAGYLKRIVGTCGQWRKPPGSHEILLTVCWLPNDET